MGVGYDWDADEASRSRREEEEEGGEGGGDRVRGGRGGGFISRETGRAAVCRWWLAGAPQLGPPPAWPLGALL